MPQDLESKPRIEVYAFAVLAGKVNDWLNEIEIYTAGTTRIVIMGSDSVYGKEHIVSAVVHARRAISSKRSRARDPAIEILRWITGQRQVSRALRMSSVNGPGSRIMVALISDEIFKDEVKEPVIITPVWKGNGMIFLKPLEEVPWGGSGVLNKMGIREDIPEADIPKAVLERVAITDL